MEGGVQVGGGGVQWGWGGVGVGSGGRGVGFKWVGGGGCSGGDIIEFFFTFLANAGCQQRVGL